jgi:VWFA-related protein
MKRNLFFLLVFVFVFCLAAGAQDKPKPLSIGFVVDNSNSFRKAMDYVDHTVRSLADNLQDSDEAFLLTFVDADKINIAQDFTADKDALKSASEDMFNEGGQTAVSEALYVAAKHLLEKGKNERKILILVSDGDNRSAKKITADTLQYLKDKKVSVYIAGITAVLETDPRESKRFLERVADETGGALVLVDRQIPYKDVADQVMKAVRAQQIEK